VGSYQFSNNFPPHGSVKVRTHVVGRLGLGLGPHVVGRLGSEMRVSASFQIIPRPVGRLGLVLRSAPHVVGRLGLEMRVSASFQLR